MSICSQLVCLRELMKDIQLGERHMLLIGNQGTGKNKLADRLLELLGLEREYIQLHRDTTVQNLTMAPTLQSGALNTMCVFGWVEREQAAVYIFMCT